MTISSGLQNLTELKGYAGLVVTEVEDFLLIGAGGAGYDVDPFYANFINASHLSSHKYLIFSWVSILNS